MGNHIGLPQTTSYDFTETKAGHKLSDSSSPQDIPSQISSGSVPDNNPEPFKVPPNSTLDKQKILEATERRLKESRKRGVQKGQGKLSQKLQKECEKNLKDYAAENLAQRQAKNRVDWRD